MAASSNPFADLIPVSASANTAPIANGANPFADLIPSNNGVAPLPPLTKEQRIKKFSDAVGVNSTPLDTLKNIAAGLGTAGQNVASTLTGGYAPTFNMEETFALKPENRSTLVQGVAQYSPLIAAGPLGLLGDLVAGGAYGYTQEPEAPITSAAITGGSNASFGLLNTLMQSSNPIIKAAARSTLGGLLGYGVGGKEGALVGSGLGFAAPNLAKRVGFGKQNYVEDLVNKVNPEEYEQTAEAGLRLNTPLSVGEASGRPDVVAQEAQLGRVGDEAVTQKVKTGQERIAAQKQAIINLQGQISPEGGDAALAIRKAAEDHLEELKNLREEATDPYYKLAENEQIPQHELDKLLEVPRIKKTFYDVLDDPDLSYELGGMQPTGKKMISMIGNRIDSLIEKARAKPYNKMRIDQLEYAKSNLKTDFTDPTVQTVLKEIYTEDPVFHGTANGINTRSIKFLDEVKKKLNTDAENLLNPINTSRDRRRGGLIQAKANKITEITDQYSPTYKKARSIHEQMSPEIDSAEEGVIGRLARMTDTELKNASKMIFDPAQTNIRVLGAVKKQIMRRDPEAWNRIVRNEIERLNKKGEISGVQFYNNVLKNDNQFKQFELALDHNPEALQTLRDMKMAWKNMSNIITPKTAKGRAETAMDTLRQSFGAILDMFTETVNSKQQAEAIKYLYSPKWVADAENIRAIKNKAAQEKQMAIMFAKIIPPSFLLNSRKEDK